VTILERDLAGSTAHQRSPLPLHPFRGDLDAFAAALLLLQEPDLPGGWAEAARRDGQVTVAIGPRTAHWDQATTLPQDLAAEAVGLLESSYPAGSAAGCACAALTAGHVAELVDVGVLATAGVRVVPGRTDMAAKTTARSRPKGYGPDSPADPVTGQCRRRRGHAAGRDQGRRRDTA
jgi:hypothetical protein